MIGKGWAGIRTLILFEARRPRCRGLNRTGKRGEQLIARSLKNDAMEALIGSAALNSAKSLCPHDLERAMHLTNMVFRSPRRGHGGGGRLDQAAQFEQLPNEARVGLAGKKHPGEQIRVEHVPASTRCDVGARLRTTFQQPLGGENTHCLAIGRPGDLQRFRPCISPLRPSPGR